MLQPSQLTDVATEYAADVVELHAFLAKAGIPVGTSKAIATVASQARQDAAFHRDLTVTLWLITDGRDRQIGFADLLGILAIASAGVRLASDADEEDALALLEFLKEVRGSRKPAATTSRRTDGRFPATPNESPVADEAVAQQAVQPSTAGIQQRASVKIARPTTTSPVALSGSSRGRSFWFIAGTSLLLASMLIAWLYRRSFVTQPASQQARVAADSKDSGTQAAPGQTAAFFPGGSGRAPSTLRPEISHSANIGPHRSVAPKAGDLNTARLPASDQANVRSAPPVEVASTTSLLPGAETSTIIPATSRPAFAAPHSVVAAKAVTPPISASPVPASTLSKRLGTPTWPQYASDQVIADSPKHPRLLRRHPLPDADAGLVAEFQPMDRPSVRSPVSAAGSSAGSVRPTALGITAANLLYSPAPPYPAAASAAHISGEVKLQAEIDRDGSVTYARVVSGPPLLRDAALNAVQQWRYRPYLSRGKAIPFTALAVMDFQLP